jgi:hypothetical protein
MSIELILGETIFKRKNLNKINYKNMIQIIRVN